jgi:hypothetical protein
MTFSRRSPAGEPLPGGVGAEQRGIEYASRGDGGMFVASFKPSGATSMYDADAYIAVSQSNPGAGFFESKTSLLRHALRRHRPHRDRGRRRHLRVGRSRSTVRACTPSAWARPGR